MSAATLRVPLACWHESLESARTDPLTQLSVDGAFLMTDRPLTVGLPVFLELRLGTSSNAAVGQIDAVVTSKRNGGTEAGFDVRFVQLDDALREWIKRHVSAHMPAPALAPLAEEAPDELGQLAELAEEESLSDGFALRPATGEESSPTDPFAVFDEPSAPPEASDDNFDPFAPAGFAPSAPAFAEDSGTDAEEGFGFFDEPSRPATPSLTATAANPFSELSVDDAVPAPEPIAALDPFATAVRPLSGDDFAPMASLDGTDEDLGVDLEPFDDLEFSTDLEALPTESMSPDPEPEPTEPPELPARSNPSLAVFDEVVSEEESTGGSSFDFGEARPQTAILGTRVPTVPPKSEPAVEKVEAPEVKPEPRAFKNTQRIPIPDFAPKAEPPPSETQAFRPDPALLEKPTAQPEPFPDAQFETQAFSVDEVDATVPDTAPEPEAPPAKKPVEFETTERFVITTPEKSEPVAPQGFSSTQRFAVWTPDAAVPVDDNVTSPVADEIPTVVGEVQDYDLKLSRQREPVEERPKPRITDQFAAWTPPTQAPQTVAPEAAAELKPMVLEGLEPSANETLPLGVQPKDLKELARAFPEEDQGRTSTLRFGAVNPTPAPVAPSIATIGPPASLPQDEVIDWNNPETTSSVSPFMDEVSSPASRAPDPRPDQVSPFLDSPAHATPQPQAPLTTPRPLTPAMGNPIAMSAEALELVDAGPEPIAEGIEIDFDLDIDEEPPAITGEPIAPRVLTLDELGGTPVGAIELPVARLAGGSERVELNPSAFPEVELPLDPFGESTGPQPVAQGDQVPVSLSFGADEWQVNEPGTADQEPEPEEAFDLDLDLAIDDSAFTGEEVPTDDLDEQWVVASEENKE